MRWMGWIEMRWDGMGWDGMGSAGMNLISKKDYWKVISLILKVNCYVARAEELKQHLKQRSASEVAREPGHVLSE